jgi:hypothetical protein
MSEVKTKVQSVKIDYICDVCGTGKMRSNGMTLTSFPPQFPHKCDSCNYELTLAHKYPMFGYEEMR